MQIVAGQKFQNKRDRGSKLELSDLELRDCMFEGCSFGVTRDPKQRSTLRNARIINCSQQGCSVGPAIFENVLVDGLKTNGQLLQIWGAAFQHVTIQGKIERMMLSPSVVLTEPDSPINKAFVRLNAEYYAGVDWALDITKAEAKELEIQGIPAKLIRRDPETQVVVRAENAIKNHFDELDYGKSHWKFSIQFMLNRGESDVVLVAPKKNPKFKTLVAGLQMLRETGIAEPD